MSMYIKTTTAFEVTNMRGGLTILKFQKGFGHTFPSLLVLPHGELNHHFTIYCCKGKFMPPSCTDLTASLSKSLLALPRFPVKSIQRNKRLQRANNFIPLGLWDAGFWRGPQSRWNYWFGLDTSPLQGWSSSKWTPRGWHYSVQNFTDPSTQKLDNLLSAIPAETIYY